MSSVEPPVVNPVNPVMDNTVMSSVETPVVNSVDPVIENNNVGIQSFNSVASSLINDNNATTVDGAYPFDVSSMFSASNNH